jgi:photosystem II stability/assembly factor-like uncharacterized protein
VRESFPFRSVFFFAGAAVIGCAPMHTQGAGAAEAAATAEAEEALVQESDAVVADQDQDQEAAVDAPAEEAETTDAVEEEEEKVLTSGAFSGLRFRSIGPALMSGRIGDVAVNPHRDAEYYVAGASGNVWKTVNDGITFEPIFDNEGSYSIGCITMDPNNVDVVWVGTGENNSQRSVSWGDGVYKSTNGGKSWTNMGLPDSEHIGMIAIDPRDSDTVYVASQGPLWNSGGDRGLYKTTDGGETWERILHVSDETGINEIHLDPRNPDVMYVSAYQRRRHVWTLINGGPEGGIWKSEDAGATWRARCRGRQGQERLLPLERPRRDLEPHERPHDQQPPVLQRDHLPPDRCRHRLLARYVHARDPGRRTHVLHRASREPPR